MPLIPKIQITQEFCEELTIKDVTPAYSPEYPGGYGVINIEADKIISTKVTLNFGKIGVYEYETPYNQTKEDIIISAFDFKLKKSTSEPCGNCGDNAVSEDSFGYLTALPSGCIDIVFQVYSQSNTEPSGKKLEGSKAIKFLSTCSQDKKLLELADKITTPRADGNYNMLPEKRREIMENLILSWTKLQLMEESDGCDCDCIAGRLKLIDAYLNSIRL